MNGKRMLWQIYLPFFIIIVLSLVTIVWYTLGTLRQFYLEQSAVDLENQALLLRKQIRPNLDDPPFIDALCKETGTRISTRVTVILPDGKVIGDTEENPEVMENHRSRPEIAEALRGRLGTSLRFSNTIQKNLMYVAVPVYDNNDIIAVIRTSYPLYAMDQVLSEIKYDVAGIGLIVILLSAVAGLIITRHITRPLEELTDSAERLARGETDYRLPHSNTREIGGLAEAVNHMARQLNERIEAIFRQNSERQSILASMTEGVLAVDSQERVMLMNNAAARLLDIDPETSKGEYIQEIVRNSELHRLIGEALKSGKTIEVEINLTGGEERFLQAHGTALVDSDGQRKGALVVLNDLTRIRQLENIGRQFVANASHELKTPITSIKGFVETLLDGAIADQKETDRFLRILLKQTNRLSAIVDDILILSEIEQAEEKAAVYMQDTPVCETLEAAVRACEIKAGEKNIRLDIACKPEVTARISTSLMEHAVFNLIDNAINYSPPDTTVDITAARENASVVIRVADQGCGIDEAHHSRIFQRFYRVDRSRSRDSGGTGLGLAIVKHIVQAHRGRITVESTPNKGSTFTIILPASS